jgi:hypothetical protein
VYMPTARACRASAVVTQSLNRSIAR